MTVNHNIGKVPDFLLVIIDVENFKAKNIAKYGNVTSYPDKANIIYFTYGFS